MRHSPRLHDFSVDAATIVPNYNTQLVPQVSYLCLDADGVCVTKSINEGAREIASVPLLPFNGHKRSFRFSVCAVLLRRV
jgi:hypothetical protein